MPRVKILAIDLSLEVRVCVRALPPEVFHFTGEANCRAGVSNEGQKYDVVRIHCRRSMGSGIGGARLMILGDMSVRDAGG